jgi:glycerophosphoryl diester phosphodiesterase
MIGTNADDRLVGTAAGDTIDGAGGDDTIEGLGGGDYLRGGDGNDLIYGADGFDDINGNKGDDTGYGGSGEDWVVGGQGADKLFGDSGNDIIYGNLGNDTLEGGVGDDLIRGGQGNDLVNGGDGKDLIFGDLGSDVLYGGAGGDTFQFSSGHGSDSIMDFSRSEGDHLKIDAGASYIVRQVGTSTIVDFGGGDKIVLDHTSINDLTKNRIELIAHRELAGGGAEETLKSFDMAYAKGVRSMEFDLQVTKDGHVILMHDSTVDRTTSGAGAVKDLTLAQIRSFTVDGQDGAVVPTWLEVIDWAKAHPDVHLYPEVKGYRSSSDIGLMFDPIKGTALEDRTTWQSFTTSDLEYLRSHGSDSEMMKLYSALPANPAADFALTALLGGEVVLGIDIALLVKNPELVALARAAGEDVAVWTVGATSQLDAMLNLDIHRIMSNILLPQTSDEGWILV